MKIIFLFLLITIQACENPRKVIESEKTLIGQSDEMNDESEFFFDNAIEEFEINNFVVSSEYIRRGADLIRNEIALSGRKPDSVFSQEILELYSMADQIESGNAIREKILRENFIKVEARVAEHYLELSETAVNNQHESLNIYLNSVVAALQRAERLESGEKKDFLLYKAMEVHKISMKVHEATKASLLKKKIIRLKNEISDFNSFPGI